ASRRRLETIVSTPSVPQLELLRNHHVTETIFKIRCERCGEREASTGLINPASDHPASDVTIALCSQCSDEMTATAKRDLLQRLQLQGPHPGEKAIYQPIDELPECAGWKVVRPDSKARAELMVQLIEDAGLPAAVAPNPATIWMSVVIRATFAIAFDASDFIPKVWTSSKLISRLPKFWMLTSARDTLATSFNALFII